MIFEVLTIFPEIVESYVNSSILKRAREAQLAQYFVRNIRDYAQDKHQTTDDMPFGGGPGMVMKPEPVAAALRAGKDDRSGKQWPIIYLSPQGKTWNQEMAKQFSQHQGVTLICGRYEGLDERVLEKFQIQEVSLGDFVLTGGELPALMIMDSIVRLLPGVLGNAESAANDSFNERGLLDHPHYTRPEVWEDMRVPEVLMSGHHAKIEFWRLGQALQRTRDRRPDLFCRIESTLNKAEKKALSEADSQRDSN